MSEKIIDLIADFVDTKTIDAMRTFTQNNSNEEQDINLIAKMFGYSGDFASIAENECSKIIHSFKNNLKLLIQKTWVEKDDVTLKEGILFQLDVLFNDNTDWKNSYNQFLEILSNAVYLMFGQQTKSEDFSEYSLRIDPEFGIFWYYIKSLPHEVDWNSQKCKNAVLLGMYFLANY